MARSLLPPRAIAGFRYYTTICGTQMQCFPSSRTNACGSCGNIRSCYWRSSAALGSRVIALPAANEPAVSYQPCRDQRYPKYQRNGRSRWRPTREPEFLPTYYLYCVLIPRPEPPVCSTEPADEIKPALPGQC